MMELHDLLSTYKEGGLTTEEVTRAIDCPFTHIKDVKAPIKSEIIPSGFPSMDKYEVLKKNEAELVILGARPSMGKTALMIQIATHIARTGTVLFFSLEMTKAAIRKRMLAMFTGRAIRKVHLADAAVLQRAERDISTLQLFMDDRSGLHVTDLVSAVTTFHRTSPVALVVIDYLGRIRSQDRNSKNAEIAEVTAALCEMKRNLCVPILLGCQLNRSPDKRGKESGDNFGDYRPILSDLRDSGSIEQDADIVMFLSRQEVYDGTRQGTADIRIAKNRNGEIGDFELRFTHEQAKFYDLGKESYE